jgi:hypothetical protein
MKRTMFAVVFGLFACQALAATPIEAVQFFYNDPGEELNMANINRFTGSAKAMLEAADKTTDSTDGPCIDFMLSVDGQDFDEKELKKSLDLMEAKAGDQATVVAKFVSFEAPMEVIWSLELIEGDWKVSDISSKTGDWTLSKLECGPIAQ